MSVDKSRITKQRRLMSEDGDGHERGHKNRRPREDEYHSRRGERDASERDQLDRRRGDEHLQRDARRLHEGGRDEDRYGNGNVNQQRDGDRVKPKPRKDRSLSPYSRRLALTQAMNISK